MYEILRKEQLTPVTTLLEVKAPRVAKAAKPGQFLIVRATEDGERVPLTICDFDREKESVTIVIQIIGASSRIICSMNVGESLKDVVGPLGQPSEFTHKDDAVLKGERYIFIAGGLGVAPVYPQAKYLYKRGAKVDIIIGAKSAEYLILKEEMAAVCDNLHICTDDGSAGEKGLVTGLLERLIEEGNSYTQAVAIGPMIMMKFVTASARKFNLPLVVSLNTLMVDGTGMCGACRVTIGGQTKFACVDGPEFDAYLVDFDEAMRRQGMYKEQEIERDHKCKIGIGR